MSKAIKINYKMQKITFPIVAILILSFMAAAQNKPEFDQDKHEWTEQNVRQVDFSRVLKTQLDSASPLVIDKAIPAQAEQYFKGKFPITTSSLNELILYKKMHPNVDTPSLWKVEGVELGEGVVSIVPKPEISDPQYSAIAEIEFLESDAEAVPIRMENGILTVEMQDRKVRVTRGILEVVDKNHIRIKPSTEILPAQVDTGGFALIMAEEQLDFYSVGNRCTLTSSCMEIDNSKERFRVISSNKNSITALMRAENNFRAELFKTDDSKIVLTKPTESGLALVTFDKGEKYPISSKDVNFGSYVEVVNQQGDVWKFSDGYMVRCRDLECVTVGRAFAVAQGTSEALESKNPTLNKQRSK
jgi:hypothetical protein